MDGLIFRTNRVYLLDAIIGLKNIPNEFCDIVVIDPPYNVGKNFGNYPDNMDMDDYVRWARIWINESIRILKKTGTIYIYGYSDILAHLSVEIKLHKRWLIWHYTNKNAATNKFWQRSHEAILTVWKTSDRIFNLDAVREPYTETFLKNAAGKKRASTKGRFGNKESVYKAHMNGALPRDVIKISALAGGAGRVERFFYCEECFDIFTLDELSQHSNHKIVIHPTQKPISLTTKLLNASKPQKGGLVVVPFAGTGSEILAAKQLNIEAVGFEINEDYFCMSNILINKGFPHRKKNDNNAYKQRTLFS